MDIPKTPLDHCLMFLFTGLTNFACFPLLLLSYRRGALFHSYVGFFTFLSSFMYHSQEALGIKRIYLDVGQWHKLDNVGSIMAWIMVMVNFMDNLDRNRAGVYVSPIAARADYHLLYFGLILTLCVQTKNSWNLKNSAIPIILFIIISAGKILFIRRPRIDSRYLIKGIPFFLAAMYCFVKGLDEHHDYLRIHHGLWHLFSSIGIFYMWQAVDKMKQDPVLHIGKFKDSVRFGLKTAVVHMLTLGWVPLEIDGKVKAEL